MKAVLLLALLVFYSGSVPAQTEEAHKGRKAPNFSLEDLSGRTVELKDFLGKGPVVINFWATWCKPCLEELLEFRKIYQEYESKNVTMLAISTDSEKSVAKVKPFVRARRYPYTILLDTNSEVARLYYAQTIPYSVVLNKDGYIVYSHVGYKKGDELEVKKVIDDLLTN